MSLNNPYFPYPRFPLSGYYDLKVYNQNLIILDDYIQELTRKINKKVLFHLTIGSAAEELHNELKTDIGFNWQQLLPIHLQNSIKNNLPVYNIIISPSKCFNEDYTPLFVENTPEYRWYKESHNTFKSAIYNVTIKIFYCPMPSSYNYTKILAKLKKKEIEMFSDDYISQFFQNEKDTDFIDQFYNNLKALFLKVNSHSGFVTCFSFAVFNDETSNSIYRNYYLFKEIKELFTVDYRHNNRLLAEWIYRLGFYNLVIHNKDDFYDDFGNSGVSFVNPNDINNSNGKIPLLDLSKDKILIKNYENPQKIINKILTKNNIDPNSLYTCVYSEVLNNNFEKNEEKIISYLKLKTFKTILHTYQKEEIYNYLIYHDYLNNLNCNLDLYENYITEDGFSVKGQKIRTIIKIPKYGMCYDELELEALSQVVTTQIIVYDHKLKFIKKFGNYNDFIELVYDCHNMTYEKYVNPQNSKSLKLSKPLYLNKS